MKRPPRAGVASREAQKQSLGGDELPSTEANPEVQRRYRLALHFDLQANCLLFAGKHAQAEFFSHRAAELRQAGAA